MYYINRLHDAFVSVHKKKKKEEEEEKDDNALK